MIPHPFSVVAIENTGEHRRGIADKRESCDGAHVYILRHEELAGPIGAGSGQRNEVCRGRDKIRGPRGPAAAGIGGGVWRCHHATDRDYGSQDRRGFQAAMECVHASFPLSSVR